MLTESKKCVILLETKTKKTHYWLSPVRNIELNSYIELH